MHNPESVLENETQKLFWDFLDTNRSPNQDQTTRHRNYQQKVEFAEL